MECQFQVGDKVVCVSDDVLSGPPGHVLLTPIVFPLKGRIYTVRALEIGLVSEKACLRLEEISDQMADVRFDGDVWEVDIIFEASDFRPLVTRKTDISCFTSMLNTQRTGVPA